MKLNDISEVIAKEVKQITDFINTFALEIGVIDGTVKDRKDGVTNAELMYIHEFGSPLRNIPSRPVLDIITTRYLESGGKIDQTINHIIDYCLKNGLDEDYVERQLKILAKRMQNDAREIIRQGKDLQPLSPNNPRRKKDSNAVPLLDTGQLMRSIICRLIKK